MTVHLQFATEVIRESGEELITKESTYTFRKPYLKLLVSKFNFSRRNLNLQFRYILFSKKTYLDVFYLQFYF